MLKGFKEFILRGNVVELATAVVIGAAFTAIVTGLVEGVFNPVIALIFDADSLSQAGITLREGTGDDDPDIVLSWGRVISAVIQFLLVATVIYFALVFPMNLMKKRAEEAAKKNAPAPAAPAPTDVELLTEIRDLLKKQQGDTSPESPSTSADAAKTTPSS